MGRHGAMSLKRDASITGSFVIPMSESMLLRRFKRFDPAHRNRGFDSWGCPRQQHESARRDHRAAGADHAPCDNTHHEQVRINPHFCRRSSLCHEDIRLPVHGRHEHPFMLPLWNTSSKFLPEVQAHPGSHGDGLRAVVPRRRLTRSASVLAHRDPVDHRLDRQLDIPSDREVSCSGRLNRCGCAPRARA